MASVDDGQWTAAVSGTRSAPPVRGRKSLQFLVSASSLANPDSLFRLAILFGVDHWPSHSHSFLPRASLFFWTGFLILGSPLCLFNSTPPLPPPCVSRRAPLSLGVITYWPSVLHPPTTHGPFACRPPFCLSLATSLSLVSERGRPPPSRRCSELSVERRPLAALLER